MNVLPRTPSFRLDGRRALITGASSGIGLGAAMALGELGARLTCVARRRDRLEETVAKIHSEDIGAEALVLDIGDTDALRSALGEREAFDIVVNSAGLARHSAALETTETSYDAVMNINLRAAYFLSTEAARAMIAAGRPGSIIHISSQMGHVGGLDRGVYCASKHGLEGMVKAMAIEWGGHGIRVNTVAPTFVDTPLGQATLQNAERLAWIEDKIKLGRIAKIEDIMGAIAWLSSDAAAMVTGTSVLIDGGWTAG